MSYAAQTDFLALLRQTSGGVRSARMPGLDYIIDALSRANIFSISIGLAAPTSNQATTVWLQPASAGSWTGEGTIFLWNPADLQYEPATPTLWSFLFTAASLAPSVQDITAPGPVNIAVGSTIVRVNQLVGAPIVLNMPLSSTKSSAVLISDWKGDASVNNITVNLTGTDKFPGGLTSWVIAANTGSIFLRPVPGGYVL